MITNILNNKQKQLIKKILFAGNKHFCNLCNSKVRFFRKGGIDEKVLNDYQVIGGGVFENDICPVCGGSYRERLLHLYFETTGFYSNKKSVFHIAPEKNISQKITQTNVINYISGDYSPDKYPFLEKIVKLDIIDLPFEAEIFDNVICNHVLEHVLDDLEGMREIYRVLKKGGFGVLQVPMSSIINTTIEDKKIDSNEERLSKYGQYDHVRLYQKDDYLLRLKSVGFDVKLLSAKEIDNSLNDNYLYKKLCLHPKEELVIAFKR